MKITNDTFIVADTHFGHANVLEYEPDRKTVLGDNPDQRMADLWNKTVGVDDIVFHLGDFSWKSESIQTWALKLNGTKYLLRGNHDKAPQVYLENGFTEVIDFSSKGNPAYHIAEVDGIKILFSHYPIVSDGYDNEHWQYLSKVFHDECCDINIHGHIHSMKLDESHCINVSVEAIGYTPIRLGELLIKRKLL
ncbi:MAG: metallophosphoesterase family protein [Thiovulaceae bacterium]|nr:metallophosphoesterase family protein [Sulfurimonadaceae bacterium]